MKPLAISGDPKLTHTDSAASHISSAGAILLEYLVEGYNVVSTYAGNSLRGQIQVTEFHEQFIPWVHRHPNTSTNKHTGNFPVNFW